MNTVILDVRENDEFEAEHILGSIHLPLSRLDSIAPGVLALINEKPFLIMCRSGTRAQMALTRLKALGYTQLSGQVFEGGILEWKKQGKPTLIHKNNHLPLMRQVQLVVGPAILIFTGLGQWIQPEFLIGSAFVGLGLTLAGLTGYCGLAHILALMPWNRSQPSTRSELCEQKTNCCGKKS